MASGWGINGNKGRCYDFWLEFSECMSRCRQPSDCGLLREDYLECLHHSKEVSYQPPSARPPARRLPPFHSIRRLRLRTLASDPHQSPLVLAVCVRLPRSAALLASLLCHASFFGLRPLLSSSRSLVVWKNGCGVFPPNFLAEFGDELMIIRFGGFSSCPL
jgi:hypothetical protein